MEDILTLIQNHPEYLAEGLGGLAVIIAAVAYAARRKKADHAIGPNEALRLKREEEARKAKEIREKFTVVGGAAEKPATGAETTATARKLEPVTPEAPAVPTPTPVERPKTIDEILSKTRAGFWGRVTGLLTGPSVEKDFVENLEEILYSNDLGPRTVEKLLTRVQTQIDGDSLKSATGVKLAIKDEVQTILSQASKSIESRNNTQAKPHVILVVGVNGVGKTTSIGKIAYRFANESKKVLVAAGDTFRAAAAEQLGVWTERAGVDIYSSEITKDPAAVAYEAIQLAQSKAYDVALVDTAGRLHTKENLMEELKKVKRVMDKAMPGAPHEILLVVDANTGQNALFQARQFHEALGLTGLVVTKLDGTAKGGVIVGIACELGVGVKHIGVGEKLTDLRDFSTAEYVHGLFGEM